MSVARWLETDSASNQNISSAAAIGAYTANADRMVVCDVSLDQVAGGGDYVVYITRQINGAGSAYIMLPKTTCTAAAGETAIAMQSGMLTVRSGDVVAVYVDGLAGDTTTPDVTVRWFEAAALRPTTPGQTIALDGDGYVTAASVTGDVGGKVLGGGAGEITDIGAWAKLQDYDDLAAAVRAELATELARIDIPISESWDEMRVGHIAEGTFGAVGEYIATSAQNAGAVRSNLTTELARIDAAITSRAAPGAAMTLANDAITAAKFDESTAFPLKQADTGSTAVARTGADGDTLETLSDQVDGVGAGSGLTAQETRDAMKLAPSAGAAAAGSIDDLLGDMPATILTTVVAPYAGTPGTFGYLLSLLAGLDFTAVNLVTASNAGEITIKRTLTLAAVVSGLTIPADWTACYWTVKRSTDDADADALVQILESNPPDADDGLLILMGAAVDDQTAGSLTVNQALGTVTIALDDASTAALEDAVELVWDVKVHATGGKTQPGSGTATITTAVTRA